MFGNLAYDQQSGFVRPQEVHVSNLHCGVTMMVYALVVAGISIVLFRRRDIA